MKNDNVSKAQKMNREQWNPMTIVAGRYFNEEAVVGYEMKQGPLGNPLHSNTDGEFEHDLNTCFEHVKQQQPSIELKRMHFQMPVMNSDALPAFDEYQPLDAPVSLSSTSISLAWVKQDNVKSSRVGYHFQGNQLADLRDRLAQGKHYKGLVGNLGYFMTKELNVGDHIWSHRRRFPNPDHQLPEMLSYLGFYYFGDKNGNVETAGFQSAHNAGVGITHDGEIHVLPSITCHQYDIRLNGTSFTINSLNPDLEMLAELDIALFDVNYPMTHQGHPVEFSPMLPLDGRVNLFICNQGDGERPYEEVAKIWNGACPLPSFGVLISLSDDHFKSLFPHGIKVGDAVHVQPYSKECNFSHYAQILGGLVPSIVNGKSIVPTGHDVTAAQAEQALNRVANTDAPLARTGKETNNFDALIREPSGLFIETDNHVGYLLFDGRHEMSIGANIVDVANLVQRLSEPDIDFFDGESIKNAIAIDGGSAMKAYAVDIQSGDAAVELGTNEVTMDILNRVAAGGRNAPGNDPQGLNLYSTVVMEL